MTIFQTICLFILGLCVIWWMYMTHKKLDSLHYNDVAMLYTILRVLGMEHNDAETVISQTFGGKNDGTKVSEEHSGKPDGNT